MYLDVKGKQVFASTGGRQFIPGRPTVVFLHGSGLDHTFWGLHSRFFAFRHYSVLVPDLPGHSHSAGPPLKSIETMASWLQEFITAAGATELSLVGHSQGCLVALEYVCRYPEAVRSVSFIASGLKTPVNAALIDNASNNPEAAIAMMTSWGFASAGHLHHGPIPGNSMLAGGQKTMRRNVPQALASDLYACNAYQGGQAAARSISCPAQVILAAQDRMAPRRAGMELASSLKDPELHIVAGSGHMLPLEAPDQCRSLLRDFIFATNPV